jgi:hypothetical protein
MHESQKFGGGRTSLAAHNDPDRAFDSRPRLF